MTLLQTEEKKNRFETVRERAARKLSKRSEIKFGDSRNRVGGILKTVRVTTQEPLVKKMVGNRR
jgi:hypothetical protein